LGHPVPFYYNVTKCIYSATIDSIYYLVKTLAYEPVIVRGVEIYAKTAGPADLKVILIFYSLFI
jgi:hypothetical protein